jgi:hypothetical protein
MRVEWAKAQARADRWQEEVVLLKEEMRRVIAFLDWRSTWWCAQGPCNTNIRNNIKDGLIAYANRQADLMQNLAKSFAAVWYPILVKAGLAIEWPEPYILYAQANPLKVHAPCRKAIPASSSAPEKGGASDSEDSSESDGYESPEGDDADVSPYR